MIIDWIEAWVIECCRYRNYLTMEATRRFKIYFNTFILC